ncbi:transcriptional regulator MarR family [Clostridium sp. CAG:967]|mgnify:FL=1|nr:transcriptional regulator MarR family [Clostridium sp. CAG:967]
MIDVDKVTKKFFNNIAYQIDYTANFSKSFRRIFHAKYIGEEIAPDEFFILMLLNKNPDFSQADIAKVMFRGKAHIGKILNEMETKGFVTRKYDDSLNYTQNVVTPKGAELFEKGIAQVRGNIISRTNSEFTTEELEQFISYLKRYRNMLNSIVEVKLK